MARSKEWYAKLYAMASVGASIETIAQRLGSNSRSLRRIMEKDRRAAECFDLGRGQMESELVGALYRQATDPKNKNPVPAIFLLKTMRGFVDTPQLQLPDNRVEVTFQLPAPLNREQYKELIEVAPRKALKDVNKEAT